MKTGLVMEGGAMRGMFTMGVIDIMMEHGITYDGGIGVSAGAAFGCNYKSGQRGRVIRYNKAYCKDKRFSSIRSWMKTGNLFGVDFCYHELPEKLDPFDNDAYVANPMDFYVVCTDVMTGKPVYHRCDTGIGENVDWMRASASIPLFAEIVEIDGYKLLDGGIGDAVPLAYFESIGYEKNVVILTRSDAYRKKKPIYMPLVKAGLREYPKMVEAIENRPDRYNKNIEYVRQQERLGKAFVIRPDEELHIGGMVRDANELERVYQIGRRTMEKKLEELQRFIGKGEKL